MAIITVLNVGIIGKSLFFADISEYNALQI